MLVAHVLDDVRVQRRRHELVGRLRADALKDGFSHLPNLTEFLRVQLEQSELAFREQDPRLHVRRGLQRQVQQADEWPARA